MTLRMYSITFYTNSSALSITSDNGLQPIDIFSLFKQKAEIWRPGYHLETFEINVWLSVPL
jgi:hypothetical protein